MRVSICSAIHEVDSGLSIEYNSSLNGRIDFWGSVNKANNRGNIVINNNVVEKTGKNGWNTVYGKDIIKDGQVRMWEFETRNPAEGIIIGVTCYGYHDSQATFWDSNVGVYYVYQNNGRIKSHDMKSWQNWGRRLDQNNKDYITVELNLKDYYLRYWRGKRPDGSNDNNKNKNNNNEQFTDMGFAFTDLKGVCDNGFRLTASLHHGNHQTSVKLLKYWKQSHFFVENGLKQINNQLEAYIVDGNKLLKKLNQDKQSGLTTFDTLLKISSNIEVYHDKRVKIQDNLKQLDETVDKLEEFLGNEFEPPSIENYKEWRLNDILRWIYSLDNGRYKKYCFQLRKKFGESGITGADLPSINRQDLHLSFGVTGFQDRRALEDEFLKLDPQSCKDGNKYL